MMNEMRQCWEQGLGSEAVHAIREGESEFLMMARCARESGAVAMEYAAAGDVERATSWARLACSYAQDAIAEWES